MERSSVEYFIKIYINPQNYKRHLKTESVIQGCLPTAPQLSTDNFLKSFTAAPFSFKLFIPCTSDLGLILNTRHT